MNWTSIFSTFMGVAGGGWGSAVAIIAALVGLFFLVRAWRNFKAKQLHEQTEDQAAKDQTNVIIANQTQSTQAKNDEAASEAARPKKP